MNVKAVGNIADFSAKIDKIKPVENTGGELRQINNSQRSFSVKKVEDIEKTTVEVQEYLKNLAEDKDTLEEVLKYINSDLQAMNTKVEFSYNDKINQMMVQVTDKNTGEVIRSLPPEHLVKLMEKFREDGTLDGVFLSKQI